MMTHLLFIAPAAILALGAQLWVQAVVTRWSRVAGVRRLSGREIALEVLARGGVEGVRLEPARGLLSDHYDPRSRTLRLSEQNYHGRSVAAAAIAAHEAGHAIQHARAYAPLQLRSAYVPAASVGSWLSFPLIAAGFIFHATGLLAVGVILFSLVVAFQLITLPVEFDASRRAKKILAETGIVVNAEEARGVSTVLNAAALTYVAATLQAIATLLYYLHILGAFSRHD